MEFHYQAALVWETVFIKSLQPILLLFILTANEFLPGDSGIQ
jgi:hypothetical protein